MIDKAVLRQSDLVYVDTNGDGILSIIPFYGCMYQDAALLFPIPLTNKLLTDKCGFQMGELAVSIPYTQAPDHSGNTVSIVRVGSQFVFVLKDFKVPIDFLHELMQLWRLLFKEELRIK